MNYQHSQARRGNGSNNVKCQLTAGAFPLPLSFFSFSFDLLDFDDFFDRLDLLDLLDFFDELEDLTDEASSFALPLPLSTLALDTTAGATGLNKGAGREPPAVGRAVSAAAAGEGTTTFDGDDEERGRIGGGGGALNRRSGWKARVSWSRSSVGSLRPSFTRPSSSRGPSMRTRRSAS